jgi:hypothetical protein
VAAQEGKARRYVILVAAKSTGRNRVLVDDLIRIRCDVVVIVVAVVSDGWKRMSVVACDYLMILMDGRGEDRREKAKGSIRSPASLFFIHMM